MLKQTRSKLVDRLVYTYIAKERKKVVAKIKF